MNDMVATIFPKSFPIFEPNQVLTNTHLNELRQYLEGEDKLTRSKSIGTGIVSGLTFEITDDQSSITLQAGVGITSEGFIIQTEFGEQEIYRKAILYNKQKPELNVAPENADFYELISDDYDLEGENVAVNISDLLSSIGSKGLLVYLEENDIDIKSCFTTNCDDRGKQRHYAVKPMLVIIPEGETAMTVPVMRPSIPDLALESVKIPISNSPDINKHYRDRCNDKLLSSIQKAITELFNFYNSHFNEFSKGELTTPSIDLISLRDDVLKDAPHFSQYFYDFIRDIIVAYYEFLNQVEKINHLITIQTSNFRRHLMLGSISEEVILFQRDDFRAARLNKKDSLNIKSSNFMLSRIGNMINSFKLNVVKKIVIIPAPVVDRPLSDQSIPYYYGAVKDTNLYKRWNFNLTQRDKCYQVLSYHNTLYNTNPNDQFAKPLRYYHNDKRCLKIEGHVGRQKSEVINELIILRKDNRLSFDIVALRVNDKGELGEIIPNTDGKEEFKEYNFKDFLEKHPGAIHERGVIKGGTIIMIYQTLNDELDGEVIADLSLPYSCLCTQRDQPIVLKAVDDEVKVIADSTKDIHVLKNDSFDQKTPVELDFVYEPLARDIQIKVETNVVEDIKVLDDSTDPTDLEIDFDNM